ncbi:unnamed protein product, partial [Ectocarpus sp. 12 AP-2014]
AAFSGGLATALRELLSSTLDVPEERLREAPLPELVRALQREWEALLEGLSAVQEEVNLARQQARDLAASSSSETGPAAPRAAGEAAVAERLAKAERRAAELEAALAEAARAEAGVRAAARAAALE